MKFVKGDRVTSPFEPSKEYGIVSGSFSQGSRTTLGVMVDWYAADGTRVRGRWNWYQEAELQLSALTLCEELPHEIPAR